MNNSEFNRIMFVVAHVANFYPTIEQNLLLRLNLNANTQLLTLEFDLLLSTIQALVVKKITELADKSN